MNGMEIGFGVRESFDVRRAFLFLVNEFGFF